MAEKLYYSMGEVTEMFDVNPSLIRYWGEQFKEIAPKRNKKGNRMFTPADIETLKMIYHLVKERGMTIEGARKALRAKRADESVPREVELLERLQRLRAMLLQVREGLGADAGVQMVDSDIAPEEEITSATIAEREEASVAEPIAASAEPTANSVAEPVPASEPKAEKRRSKAKPKAEPKPQTEQQPAPQPASASEPALFAEAESVAEREAEVEPQENVVAEQPERKLPFYEQTLF